MLTGILLSTDLMFGSKVTSAAKAAGYELKMVGSRAAVLELLRGGGVKLVILDLTSPGLNATEFVPQLSSRVEIKTLPGLRGARFMAQTPTI